jgi:hypothetical protein
MSKMLEIFSNKFGGKARWIDLYAVPVPGTKKLAHELTGPDLYAEMKKLGLKDIGPLNGWMDLCTQLGVWLQEQKERAA